MKEVQDRVVQFSNRYKLTNVATGEVLGTFDFDEVTGTVQQVGTEIDKELFDSISADITAEAQARAQADTKETEARTAADNTLQSNINKEAQTRAAADTTLQGNIDAEKAARETAVKTVNDKADAHIARVDNPHAVTKAQVGLGNVNNTSDANKPVSTAQAAAIADAKQAGTYAQQLANAHIARTDNPHSVTKAQVGLGNVDNTSDINKPVSTLQAKAIADAKKAGTDAQNTANTHIANKSNPHAVTKAQIGLENVDNTSDKDKPVSTAQAAAIKQEADAREAEDNDIKAELNNKYIKPSTGIPKTDLAESVQQSIAKADTALQYIPIASPSTLGGVKPVVKTSEMTQPVGINALGALFTKPADLSELANPNILINSNFKINQRGATVYNSSNYGYSVDRWALTSGSAAWKNSRLVPKDNGSITVYNNYSAAIDVNQPIERGVIISGETYTLSATVDGVRKSVTFVADIDMSAASITFTNAVVEFAKFYNSNTDYRVILRTNAGEIVTFNNVKLEHGNIATAYVPPDPSIEIVKCQRFYHARRYEVPIIYNPGKGNYGGGQVNFPVTMRVAPTIKITAASISSNSSPLDDTYYNSVDQNGFFAYTGNSYNGYLRFNIRYTADAEI